MIDKVSLYDFTSATLPYKFEAGTPMIGQVIGLGAAIDFITGIGIDVVHKHEQRLFQFATEELEKIELLRIIGKASNKSSIISFRIDGMHPLDLVTMLDCRSVAMRTGHLCSQPAMNRFGVSSMCRISFGLYNQIEEIAQFIDFLKFFINR